MLRSAKSRPFLHTLHRSPWLGACVQSFENPFASKASKHDHALTGTRVKLSASKASRIHGNASVSESKSRRKPAHDRKSTDDARGDAKNSVLDAVRRGVDGKSGTSDAEALACSHHNAAEHSADGDVKVSGFAACMPHAKALYDNGDVREAETAASSCETQPPCVALKTLSKKTQKEERKGSQVQKAEADLQEKIMVLESEQFSPWDARRLLRARAFKSCTVQQLATVLQELKRSFACAKVVHDIVVRSSNVLLSPAELVQQKLKLLQDFQVEEKVIRKLCSLGGVLSVSLESLQSKLRFYDNIGLTVAARNTMLWRGPLMLKFNIETSIQPRLKFLGSLGLTKESVLKTVQCSPHIFYVSLDNLMTKYEYIRQVGFCNEKFPTILFARSICIQNIKEHLRTLSVLGFTDDDVRLMLNNRPSIVALSSTTLKKKVDFLIIEQHRKLAEIVRCPTCLMYSLQTRMIPRFKAVNELGLSKVYALQYILGPSNSAFADWLREQSTQKTVKGGASKLES